MTLGIEHGEGGLRAGNYFRGQENQARGRGSMWFRRLLGSGERGAYAIEKGESQATAQHFVTNPRARHGRDSTATGVRERNRQVHVNCRTMLGTPISRMATCKPPIGRLAFPEFNPK